MFRQLIEAFVDASIDNVGRFRIEHMTDEELTQAFKQHINDIINDRHDPMSPGYLPRPIRDEYNRQRAKYGK